MLKKIWTRSIIIISLIICFNYVEASPYEWDMGGLIQMDYDSINAEEVEIELSFYCGLNRGSEGGALSAASKPLVYGNLANNYYTGWSSATGKATNNGYSLGTNVYIKDVGLFTIEDRGGDSDFNTPGRMDLYVARKEGESDDDWYKRTNSYGHVKVKAKIIKDGTQRNWVWPSGDGTIKTPTTTGTTTTVNSGINKKITYNVTKNITTMGEKPPTLTTNCKDAVEAYWSKTTILSGNGSGALTGGSPEVSIDYDRAEVPDEILNGTSKEKFNWLFDGNWQMAYGTTESEILKYIISIDVPRIDENGNETVKTLQVHKKVAGDIYRIFEEIKAGGFKIRGYDTGAYNWRGGSKIGSSGLHSMHCLGIAVDVNWDSNAYYVGGQLRTGKHWKPGVDEFSMPADGVAVMSFKKYGWKWGGDWSTAKDYMHFSLTGN